jgi:hypothetical protein
MIVIVDLLVLTFLIRLTAGRSVHVESSQSAAACRWSLPTSGMDSSYWLELLHSGRFRPALEAGGHHVTRLRHQLHELRSAVEFYKDPFTWTYFGKLFHQADMELAGVR